MEHPSNLRDYSALKSEKFNEERVSTPTSTEQVQLLSYCMPKNLRLFIAVDHIIYVSFLPNGFP